MTKEYINLRPGVKIGFVLQELYQRPKVNWPKSLPIVKEPFVTPHPLITVSDTSASL